MQGLHNQGLCVIKLIFVACLHLTYKYLTAEKTLRHVENLIMMFNHAVNACQVHVVFYVKFH